MNQIQFFALREDILPVLETIEGERPLHYVSTGNFATPNFQTFLRAAEIPNLGKADRDTGSTCSAFLITTPSTPVNTRIINLATGDRRYCIDQLSNPDTIVLRPAGLWEQVILNGQVATVSRSAISSALMKQFSSALKKRFTKIKAFQVGPQALMRFNAGKRLTISAQSPRDFDLTATREL